MIKFSMICNDNFLDVQVFDDTTCFDDQVFVLCLDDRVAPFLNETERSMARLERHMHVDSWETD